MKQLIFSLVISLIIKGYMSLSTYSPLSEDAYTSGKQSVAYLNSLSNQNSCFKDIFAKLKQSLCEELIEDQ